MSPRHSAAHVLRYAFRVLLIATAAVAGLLLVGFLALFLLFGFLQVTHGRVDRARLDIQNIAGALKLYHAKTGRLPSTAEGLQPLVSTKNLEQVPLDPWNNPYRYELREGQVELVSFGADGQPGGSGLDEDITLSSLRQSTASADGGT